MTIVQVKDATGSVLDWMAAKACYPDEEINLSLGFPYLQFGRFNPTSDWRQGGPIIDREKIDLFTEKGTPESWMSSIARYQNGERLVGWRIHMYGPTPLIAVMRCYVASKLGEVVKVPQELL